MTEARGARFLTVEGIEGVGKSTQVSRLAAALHEIGIVPRVTREPGGTALAESIRELVLRKHQEPMPPVAELLLMFAARSVHLANHIEPNLSAGHWVICDRFTDASYAYQGGGRGIDAQHIAQLERLVQGARRPDLTLLLDAPVEQALERAQRRNATGATDRFEAERNEFFVRTRAAYLARAALEPERIAVVDARGSAQAVTSLMLAVLKARSWIS